MQERMQEMQGGVQETASRVVQDFSSFMVSCRTENLAPIFTKFGLRFECKIPLDFHNKYPGQKRFIGKIDMEDFQGSPIMESTSAGRAPVNPLAKQISSVRKYNHVIWV